MSLAAQPDDTVVTFQSHELNQFFTCPLCTGYLIDASMVIECMHAFCKSCILKYVYDGLKTKNDIKCPVCDICLHPSDPLSDIRFDQTLQDISFLIVPQLFDKECKRRREFCDENKIDYKVPSFKSNNYTPGLEMVNTHESSTEDEEEATESDNVKAIAKELEDDAWIQCEHEECLKWRRVPLEVAETFEDEPWYCEFNPDEAFNSCSIPEVNHLQYEKMAEQAGLTYVYSNMLEGTLVQAKLTGFTAWPAIICNDPIEGNFFDTNDNGNPTKYHVEFLGKRHTQAWVEARSTVNYAGIPKEPPSKNGKKMPQALIDAYFEAEDLRGLSNEERLEQCVLSNGLARRFHNQKAKQTKKAKRKRKRPSYVTSESDTDDILESISFHDQPGEIQAVMLKKLYSFEPSMPGNSSTHSRAGLSDLSQLVELTQIDERLAELELKCRIKYEKSGWTVYFKDPARTESFHTFKDCDEFNEALKKFYRSKHMENNEPPPNLQCICIGSKPLQLYLIFLLVSLHFPKYRPKVDDSKWWVCLLLEAACFPLWPSKNVKKIVIRGKVFTKAAYLDYLIIQARKIYRIWKSHLETFFRTAYFWNDQPFFKRIEKVKLVISENFGYEPEDPPDCCIV
ncbi:Oidioi.mRNA.OKI2018_I69.XSR.g15498.t3.cds [Oikopleura dioica]|uniref:Oidioi.mRNA.OKI2018_I69.XSR.g15498.t3.cds n=1 Tax=Oikopleura dioica TaxID=34765 RepID=A0ABN7SD16_OIKDI|nr:Oidioi.mRNA.OKI2018_I69.XSR.g15498.t3.cds [Oikopleura dioica]